MLVIKSTALYEIIYNCAKKIYPELVDTVIIVDDTSADPNVSLLKGTGKDKGKYKVLFKTSEDESNNTSSFIGGLSMIVYDIKYNKKYEGLSDEYKAIFETISEAFLEIEKSVE